MRLILAPLQDVTGYLFRNVWQRYFEGLDEGVTPFLPAVTGLKVRRCHLRDVLPEHQDGMMTLVPQLMGSEAEAILRTTEAIAGLGYREVNLNMGCPSATVTKKRRGCGLLPFPDMVDRLLDHVMPHLALPLSVKIRLGMHSKDEVWPIIKVFNNYPLHRIIVHPRLGVQQYDGEPDHQAFAQMMQATQHHLVYNGDINTLEYFKGLQHRFAGVDDWMLGRGVLMNPFLPGMIKGASMVSPQEAKHHLFSFQQELMGAYGEAGLRPERIAAKTKEYWFYFSHWFKEQETIWYRISRSTKPQEIKTAISEAFKNDLALFD